jgi:hypothetical protein
MKLLNYLFGFAAIWALLVGVYIFSAPYGIRVSESVSSDGTGEIVRAPVSFFETQGWWGVWILIAFTALHYSPLHFHRRSSRAMAALFAVSAIILSILAGFSIGAYYFPATLALLIGLVLLLFSPKH